MNRDDCIGRINSALSSPIFHAKRSEFVRRFGTEFQGFFLGLELAIEELRLSNSALALSLLDSLPATLTSQLRQLSPEVKGLVAKELVCRMLGKLNGLIERSLLPLSILQQYPVAVAYMVNSIVCDLDEIYGDEHQSYADRDLRMASGFTIPAGVQILDLRCWLPRSFYRNQGVRENLRCLSFVVSRLGGLGPVIRMHIDTRNLEDFNPVGRRNCYLRIAELLDVMPAVKGLVGTSWYFDPQLETVSPKLNYLREVPASNGAFLRIDGPGEIHTQRAITRSPTRKKLFDEGLYRPTCATLVWPRRALLRWSKGQS